MSNIPFNVTLLVLTPDRLRGLRPVTKLDHFEGNSDNFCEDGLFSISIFGKIGSDARTKRFSFINVKVPILHPIIYNTLVSLKRLYAGIISGTEYVLWNEEIKDFDRANALTGKTGFAYFMEYWEQIEFKASASLEREQNILLMHKYMKTATTTNVIVMPAGLRDMEISADGRKSFDEINDLYRKLLSISNTISEASVNLNPEIVNIARLGLQNTFNKIYATIEAMIEGKKKLLLGKWASRRIFNGTRNVITAMDTSSPYLDAPNSIGINDTIVGLYQGLKSIMPVARNHIKNGFLTKVFISPNAPAYLVDKKTRKIVSVNLKTQYYDRWMTDEGIEKVLTSFADESIRNKPIEIEGHYLGLIYKGPDGTFKIIQDIDDVPGTRSKLDVYPLTFCELLYLSCYTIVNKYPAVVTRYPITGVGSIYPSNLYMKTTIKSEIRRELNDSWEAMDNEHIAYEFPTTGAYLNSMVPHSIRLVRAGADFDGDMMSCTAGYSDEVVEEIRKFHTEKKAYVGTDGKFISSTNVDTVALVLFNMTGD